MGSAAQRLTRRCLNQVSTSQAPRLQVLHHCVAPRTQVHMTPPHFAASRAERESADLDGLSRV